MEHTIQIIHLILRPCLIQFYNKTFHLFWANLSKKKKKFNQVARTPAPAPFDLLKGGSHRLGIISAAYSV